MTESDFVLMGKYLLEMALLGLGWGLVFLFWILCFMVVLFLLYILFLYLAQVFRRNKRGTYDF